MPTPGPAPAARLIDLPTTRGLARVHLGAPHAEPAVGWLLLGHGAGGGVAAPDLVAVRDAARAAGWLVALVEQPWRVAGRRVATAPARLDEAWTQVLGALAPGRDPGLPLVVGGRSAGARVSCRTARQVGAAGVCCLAFPLHPPGRPERSRAAELTGDVPTLVVQGRRDPFGTADDVAAVAPSGVRVEPVDGDHGLSRSAATVGAVVVGWLARWVTRDDVDR